MAYETEDLYRLLPAIYRWRDAENGQPLRALIAVMAEQAAVIEADIARLYENWFVETCDEWVVPYIGDLLGVRGLHPVAGVTGAAFSQRARVANTLGYRRRKGTASMLEQLARDTTGWPARVVECFQLLATNQHVNHVRLENVRTPDVRRVDHLDLLDGPFDTIAHTADVRHIDRTRGRHNIVNVATFLWRLQAFPIDFAPAFPHGNGRFSFSQLGQDVPLFTHPVTEADPAHLADEVNVPAPIRRLALEASLASNAERYYGGDRSFRIWVGRAEVPRERIVACNLSGWAHGPSPGRVAVDPQLGRVVFPVGEAPDPAEVRVDYHYGASSDVGGGCYERALSDAGFIVYRIGKHGTAIGSMQAAIDRWAADGSPDAVLEIQDNDVYDESLSIVLPPGRSIEIRAANKRRPVLRLAGPLLIRGMPSSRDDQPGGRVTFDGLLIVNHEVRLLDGDLGLFEMKHCTLVPGRALTAAGTPAAPGAPSIVVVEGNARLAIVLTRTMAGGLHLPGIGMLTLTDCLIDGTSGPAIRAEALTVRESTVIGSVTATLVECASNSIFTGVVRAERKQAGCVRFCYLPSQSDVPRRYRCQPDLAIEMAREGARTDQRASRAVASPRERALEVRGRVRPSFTDTQYARPGYGQLHASCPPEIKTGADDQGEMGVFHHLMHPLRESNFRASLDEYLRLGLEAGILYVT